MLRFLSVSLLREWLVSWGDGSTRKTEGIDQALWVGLVMKVQSSTVWCYNTFTEYGWYTGKSSYITTRRMPSSRCTEPIFHDNFSESSLLSMVCVVMSANISFSG